MTGNKDKRIEFRTTDDILDRLKYIRENSMSCKGFKNSKIIEEAVRSYSNNNLVHGFMYDLVINNVSTDE